RSMASRDRRRIPHRRVSTGSSLPRPWNAMTDDSSMMAFLFFARASGMRNRTPSQISPARLYRRLTQLKSTRSSSQMKRRSTNQIYAEENGMQGIELALACLSDEEDTQFYKDNKETIIRGLSEGFINALDVE